VKHFGSLRKAYALIGYKPSRNCAWIDARIFWSDILARHATKVAEALDMGDQVHATLNSVDLVVNGERKVSFLTARQMKRRIVNHRAQWRVCRRKSLLGMLVILRLDDANQAIEDYLLLPAKRRARLHLNFSDKSLAKHRAVRFKDMDELIHEIKTRLGAAGSSRQRQME